jgi:hypothetical protein
MKNLLESGVHFGHQTKRWDPRMKKFIFAERNGIHIIDLQKTIQAIKEAYNAVRKTVLEGKTVLFVGTKKQAQQSIQTEAERCNMFFVNNRWLGGMLTNFSTIKKSLMRLKKIEKMEVDGTYGHLTKKEIARLGKEKAKLEKNLPADITSRLSFATQKLEEIVAALAAPRVHYGDDDDDVQTPAVLLYRTSAMAGNYSQQRGGTRMRSGVTPGCFSTSAEVYGGDAMCEGVVSSVGGDPVSGVCVGVGGGEVVPEPAVPQPTP